MPDISMNSQLHSEFANPLDCSHVVINHGGETKREKNKQRRGATHLLFKSLVSQRSNRQTSTSNDAFYFDETTGLTNTKPNMSIRIKPLMQRNVETAHKKK